MGAYPGHYCCVFTICVKVGLDIVDTSGLGGGEGSADEEKH